MKYIKYVVTVFVLVFLLLIGFIIKQSLTSTPQQGQPVLAEHIYASWDTMEFDKCVTTWLIVRFIDKDAKFVFYPQGTEINEGIVFDVPGAAWSRKHRKCTSQCILESIGIKDPAVEKIVSMASKVELNFWQLDRWPQTQKRFYEVKEIMDQTPDPLKCFEKAIIYFDGLYSSLRNDDAEGRGI